MEELLAKSKKKIGAVTLDFIRYLYNRINFSNRLISILGARGVGKTTLLLQIGALAKSKSILYVALDDLFFTDHTLYGLAEDFSKAGGELLLLDEVHKYPNWSREIKLIYDDFPELQVIFTSSSVLDIYRGESDLSRRATAYIFHEMSFREYLEFHHRFSFISLSLDDLIKNHEDIAHELLKKFKPFRYLPEYLKHGAYPYYAGDEMDYYQKVLNTVNLVLDIDLPAAQSINYENIAKFKRLLYVLATNVPFTPNISRLSEQIKLNRNNLSRAVHLLHKAELLHILFQQSRSISQLNKPDKIWLHNTNLNYAISQREPEKGTLRETFLIIHLSLDHTISLPEAGDFLVDHKFTLEVGGRNKTFRQIQQISDAYLVKDQIEMGVMKSIPLWLFGFLY
ncbi:MAG: AAA family ATPase [Bacteroidales bacterium]|nr:AAA family ATPase [Bacteroidales bacterium]